MAVQHKDRLYKSVAANSTEDQDYVPAVGENFVISNAWGESGSTPETGVCLKWDSVLIFTTHNSGMDTYVDQQVTGDGTKALKIELINNSDSAVTMGAGWSE